MRLQKYLAECGVCSRRKAEEWIAAGRVSVNGRTAALGMNVEETDEIRLDGEPVRRPAGHTYIMLHKPRGYVTTLSDPQGRPTVTDLIRDVPGRLFPVGRLDLQSEGLLILTDDGDAANRLMHPSHGVMKVYRVRVRGEGFEAAAERLRSGVSYEGTAYRARSVEILRAAGKRALLEIAVSDGKNHEVRNMCAAVGLGVERLQRVRQGELILGELAPGSWRPLTEKELAWLRSL